MGDAGFRVSAVEVIGLVGGLLFFGRFYVQWWASERKGSSVMPIQFWYMSSCGSVLLLTYAVLTQSPLGVLSHNFNTVVYARNLVHLWRERGTLTRTINWVLHAVVAVVLLVGFTFVISIWLEEFNLNKDVPPAEAQSNWFWLAVGLGGQVLFACRFLIQWLTTERLRKSVIPEAFWWLSLAAGVLQVSSYVQREEWLFAVGIMTTLFIYARNLWMLRVSNKQGPPSVSA